jgi:hypothetical protein
MIPLKKLIITHLLMNLYLLVLIHPALPVIEYLLNYDYIVKELCENRDKPILGCDGKCYLQDQVEKQLNPDHEEEVPMPPQTEFEKFISLSSFPSTDFSSIETSDKCIPDFANRLKDDFDAASLFRPPIV